MDSNPENENINNEQKKENINFYQNNEEISEKEIQASID